MFNFAVLMTSDVSHSRPKIAIIDSNTLAMLGLKQLLQQVMPFMSIDALTSFSELEAAHHEDYAHFFVSMDIVLRNRAFFSKYPRKTIVLALSMSDTSLLREFHSLCINQPESMLIRQLLQLQQSAHNGGRHLPPMPHIMQQKILTDREIEVMSLIVQGLINKEIAHRLHIGLATVITHRRNIMEKLGLKSVSALTIYAVTHGYVDINKI